MAYVVRMFGDLAPWTWQGTTSLLSPAVQLRASRGQEQAGRCMGWKDKEHHREKRGVQLCVEYVWTVNLNGWNKSSEAYLRPDLKTLFEFVLIISYTIYNGQQQDPEHIFPKTGKEITYHQYIFRWNILIGLLSLVLACTCKEAKPEEKTGAGR